jgi:hypothetical protein
MIKDKQQTAVEWFVEQLRKNENIRWRGTPFFELSEQAKEMEKEQMIDFARKYMLYIHNEGIITIETFYNETYGGDDE